MTDQPLDVAATVSADEATDVVVLPWWQRPVNILIVLVAAALIAGMIGWLVADSGNDVASSEVDVGLSGRR